MSDIEILDTPDELGYTAKSVVELTPEAIAALLEGKSLLTRIRLAGPCLIYAAPAAAPSACRRSDDERDEFKILLAREQDENHRLREAISRVLADDESAPGGWGPDVTTVAFLRQALEG